MGSSSNRLKTLVATISTAFIATNLETYKAAIVTTIETSCLATFLATFLATLHTPD